MAEKELQQEEILEIREGISEKGESLTSVYVRRFKKHTLGKIGGIALLILYAAALFADFLSPHDMVWTDKTKSYHPPSRIYWFYKDYEGKTRFQPYSYEQRNVNVAFKIYGVIPPYSLRAISIESREGIGEMRAIIAEKNPILRKDMLIQAVARHYNLPKDHEALGRLAEEINRLERSPDPDIQMVFRIGMKEVNGKRIPLEFHLAKGNKNFLGLFHQGTPYTFLGLFKTHTHFFGSPTGGYYPWGADKLGRDQLSRMLHGSRVSLSVGLIGAFITFTFGLAIGGIAGYYGGAVDNVLMRLSEVLISFPAIYLLFALRAAFPPNLSSIQVYLLIIVILSAIGWARLSRIIRGMVLSLKNEDYVLSARTMGLSNWKIIRKHILPNTLSFVIVQATITIPAYILGESALSLLGLGINEPQSSWGLMLSVARNYRVVKDFPWILVPGFAIFIAIMAWNFFGDGVRDAVDPRSKH